MIGTVSLSNIIRTRLGGCLIVPGILLFIDGRQPICFKKASLSQPSNPRRSGISEVWGRTKARRRFADGLCALQKAATQHWGVPTPQKRVRIMLLRLCFAQRIHDTVKATVPVITDQLLNDIFLYK